MNRLTQLNQIMGANAAIEHEMAVIFNHFSASAMTLQDPLDGMQKRAERRTRRNARRRRSSM